MPAIIERISDFFTGSSPEQREHEEMMEFAQRILRDNPSSATGLPPDIKVQIEERTVIAGRFSDSVEDDDNKSAEQPVLCPPGPQIESCNPNNGKLAGGSPVDILAVPGSNSFLPTAEVYFDDIPATDVVWNNSEFISCVNPEHGFKRNPGVTVRIRNVPDVPETDGELEDAFDYLGAPYITSVAVETGTGVFIITGGNFYFHNFSYKVTFNGVQSSSTTCLDDHTIRTSPPSGFTGGDIVVIAPDFERQRSNTYNFAGSSGGYDIAGANNVYMGPDYAYQINNHAGGSYSGQVFLANWDSFVTVYNNASVPLWAGAVTTQINPSSGNPGTAFTVRFLAGVMPNYGAGDFAIGSVRFKVRQTDSPTTDQPTYGDPVFQPFYYHVQIL